MRQPGEQPPGAASRHTAHGLQPAYLVGILGCAHPTARLTQVPSRRWHLRALEMRVRVPMGLTEPQLGSSSQPKVDPIPNSTQELLRGLKLLSVILMALK